MARTISAGSINLTLDMISSPEAAAAAVQKALEHGFHVGNVGKDAARRGWYLVDVSLQVDFAEDAAERMTKLALAIKDL